MLRRKCLYAVERKAQLDVHGLLSPERAIIVERGDALVGRHKVTRALLRHLPHEFDDRLLGPAILPGRKRFGRLNDRQATEDQGKAENKFSE